MVEKLKINPLFLSAIISAVFLYSFPDKVRNFKNFYSLLNNENIVEVEGYISSNLSASQDGNNYKARLKINRVKNKNGFTSDSKGELLVYFPSEFAEAYLPGKLYSRAKNNSFLCEAGQRLLLRGKYTSDIFFAKSVESLESHDLSFLGKIKKVRALSRINFRRLMFSWDRAGGLLLALLSGIRDYTEKTLSDAFRKSGLSHVLALSGMHLSLFSGLFKKSNKFLGQKLALSFQIFAILAFVWFAGLSPSLFRAMLCSLLILFMSLLKINQIKMLSVLSLSFLIHVSLRGTDIYTLSFMLSYGALAGILIFGEFWSLVNISLFPTSISASLGASTGAQFFTAPLTIKFFNTLSPIGIISTVFISPLITIFIYSGLLCIIICLIFPLLVPFSSFLLNIQYNVIKEFVFFFAAFPCIGNAN